MSALTFSPLLPVTLIFVIALVAAIATLLRLRTSRIGTLLRLLAVTAGTIFLMSPQWRDVEGETLADIAVIFEDQSRSLEFGDRAEISRRTADRLEQDLQAEGLDVRRVAFGNNSSSDLAEALTNGLADVPRRRLSAVSVVTDGQLHGDLELAARRLDVPVHGFVTGDPAEETDRRIEIVSAPRFGVVGETAELVFRVISPSETGTLSAELFVDGEPFTTTELTIGQDVTLSVPLRTPGDRLFELALAPLRGELTPLNNRAVAALTAVRDRLRVLLVSGEPHAGERVWRNILKSDPAVDLVHFTILKPSDKVPVAREEDLNLIQFPHVELFLEKLPEFDVLIFDRYTYRGVLESFEFEQIARYVERGGAVLIASGPEFAEAGSLAKRPNLAYILPSIASGPAQERPFVPEISDTGARHPVTRDLGSSRDWGRWLRVLPVRMRSGDILMETADGSPLLVVDRVQDGRIALLLSDHAWLWARSFDGGGPHRELLRRLVHWLMKEPELEDESLRGEISADGLLSITRQSLGDDVPVVEVTDPEGRVTPVALEAAGPGLFTAMLQTDGPGLYRLQTEGPDNDTLFALAASGEERIAELGAVVTTSEHIAPLAAASGGGVFQVTSPGDALPAIRRVATGREAAGTGWAGFPRRDTQNIDSIQIRPLIGAWLALGLIGGLLLAAWLIEGQLWRRKT